MRGFVLHELREMVPNSWTGEYKTTCPKCSDSRKAENRNVKCLSINGDSKVFNCFNCGWNGKLVDKKSEVYNNPTTPLEKFAQSRGFSKEALDFMQIGCIVKGGRDYIVYPFYKDGVVVNNKYRSVEGKDFSQDTGGLQCLYGYDNVVGKKVIYLTEGENDTLALITAGFRNVCSCPAGGSIIKKHSESKKLDFIRDAKDIWKNADEVVICMDKDIVGIQWEQIVIEAIGISKCKQVEYPIGCKDCNDILIKFGKEKIKECIGDRTSFPIAGFFDYNKNKDSIFKFVNGDIRKECLSTGWDALDNYYKIDSEMGCLNTMVGIPAVGKSIFAENLIVNTVLMHRWKWAVFSPESTPLEHVLIPRMMGMLGRTDPTKLSERERRNAFNIMNNYIKLMSLEDSTCFNVDTLLVTLLKAKRMYGIRAFLLDNVNELEFSNNKDENMTNTINSMLKKLRNFARQEMVDVWLICHPTKVYKNFKGEFPVLDLYSISGSAAFYNRTDCGISLWRSNECQDNIIDVHVLKIKNTFHGKPGLCKLRYEPESQIYRDLDFRSLSNRS